MYTEKYIYCNQDKGYAFNHAMRTILMYCQFVRSEIKHRIIIIKESALTQKPSMVDFIWDWQKFLGSMCDRKLNMTMEITQASSSEMKGCFLSHIEQKGRAEETAISQGHQNTEAGKGL